MKQLLKKAFREMYPNKQMPELNVKYSGKFSDYNANVRIEKIGRSITMLEFGLSRKWVERDESIVIGIVQHLLNKVYKTNVETTEQEFYHNFLKNIGKYLQAKESDKFLEELFHELNEEYFSGLIEKPTLILGKDTLTVLGHYNFSKDTITISNALIENRELTKYVLYHEMLHKKHSFKTKNGRGQYHTKAFREDEKKFKGKDVEKQLENFIRKRKTRKVLLGKKNKKSRMNKLSKWF